MNGTDAFKRGFLLECARAGLDAPQTEFAIRAALRNERELVKRADTVPDVPTLSGILGGAKDLTAGALNGAGGLLSAAGNGISQAFPWAVTMGLKAPVLAGVGLGAGAGVLAAKATEDDFDIEDARKQEILGQLQLAIDQARQRQPQSLI